MAGKNRDNEINQDQASDKGLIKAINALDMSEVSRLQDFITLTQQIKAKQEAIDIMAADSTPYAIGSSYVADTLEPNSQGDLITLVAKTAGEQVIIDDIYRRLNIPNEKVIYSLFKNSIAIAEFAHEGDIVTKAEDLRPSSRSANESVEKPADESVEESATEEIKVKVHKSRLIPKIKMISDTTRIFPILQYEEVVGFIEITLDDFANFNFANDTISYKDVVIHSAEDYAYVKFGFRTESKPLQLRVKMADGSIVEYDIDQGKSLLEAAYPSWQTLSILKDSINLARLAYSASSVVVQTEVGNMSEAQIELAKNKLKDLFENRLAFGRNGAKSYLQPQLKPNYVYSFTKGGVGAITTSTIGGDYNPGALTDLKYFEDEFFGAMGAVKQHFARTEDGAGLDGGGAVEQYEKRYKSYVAQFKRLLAKFIKECINRVLLSRNLRGVYDNFDVIVNKAYEEDDMQIVNLQQTKLSMLQSVTDFLGIVDEAKLMDLRLQVVKSVISDKNLLEAFSNAVLTEPKKKDNNNNSDDGNDAEDDGFDDSFNGGGSDSGLMDQINNIGTPDEDLGDNPDENLDDLDTTPEDNIEPTDELPSVSDLVSEDSIDNENTI